MGQRAMHDRGVSLREIIKIRLFHLIGVSQNGRVGKRLVCLTPINGGTIARMQIGAGKPLGKKGSQGGGLSSQEEGFNRGFGQMGGERDLLMDAQIPDGPIHFR